MPHNGRNRRRLLTRWLADSRCHYCGKPTILILIAPQQRMPGRFANYKLRATLEHLRSRLHNGRQEPADGQQRIVLACHACNQAANNRETAELSLDELWRRSGRGKQTEQDQLEQTKE